MMKLCLSPACASLRVDIDFPPEVKIVLAQLFFVFFFLGLSGVKKCESCFCSMLFLASKKKTQKNKQTKKNQQKWQHNATVNTFKDRALGGFYENITHAGR